MRTALILTALLITTSARSQWDIQTAPTTADLRGIHALGNGIAWASGSEGTVLRTTDDGTHWQRCTTPPDAEALDFRGIQAFDASTAIVMSSGKGPLSRLYKTTDACQTWTLLFTNSDSEGFWDAIRFSDPQLGLLAGDPVNGKFPLWWIVPGYNPVANFKELAKARPGESAFAASNTSAVVYSNLFWLATGGTGGAHVIRKVVHAVTDEIGWVNYPSGDVPVGQHTESSGIFSLSFAIDGSPRPSLIKRGVAVGGDYRKPNDSANTAAFTADGGKQWLPAHTPPHGFRSAVAYSPDTKTWITVGPNGTDISTDDGRNWRPLLPTPGEAPDSDQHWNALSLPFAVGPHGRIGRLRPDTLKPGTP